LDGGFLLLDPPSRSSEVRQVPLVNLAEPNIQALSLPIPHHVKKDLHELIRGIEKGMCQTKSRKIIAEAGLPPIPFHNL
jgi:hypothetical protein